MSQMTSLILEITPFLSIILIETVTSGGEGKFAGEFKKQPGYKEIKSDSPATINNIENTALLSYDYEQSIKYFDIAIIVSFVVYLTKSYTKTTGVEDSTTAINNGTTSGSIIVVAGIVTIILIVGLRIGTQRYFESRKPTEYARKRVLYETGLVEMRMGDVLVIAGNLIPILSLILTFLI